jgi:hypothetical protein
MKSFLFGCLAAVVIAGAAWFVLERLVQNQTDHAYSTTGVRL